MLKIWQKQITLLGVIDTGALLASPKAIAKRVDGRFYEVSHSQAFLESGLAGLWHRPRNPVQVERREGACSHLCRGAAGVALATPPWQQRRHRQNEPMEQREQRRACSRYAESRPRKTESTSSTPQVVQPKVLRFGDEHQGVLRGQHRTLVHGHPMFCIIKRFWPQSLKKRSQWPRFSIR